MLEVEMARTTEAEAKDDGRRPTAMVMQDVPIPGTIIAVPTALAVVSIIRRARKDEEDIRIVPDAVAVRACSLGLLLVVGRLSRLPDNDEADDTEENDLKAKDDVMMLLPPAALPRRVKGIFPHRLIWSPVLVRNKAIFCLPLSLAAEDNDPKTNDEDDITYYWWCEFKLVSMVGY